MILDFLAGFAAGVLGILGALGLLAAIIIAWAKDEARNWLRGIE